MLLDGEEKARIKKKKSPCLGKRLDSQEAGDGGIRQDSTVNYK